MSNILLRLKKTLPFEDNQEARRQRLSIWERWDTSSFGFLSLSDIKFQLSDLLDLIENQNLKLIIELAYKKVIEKVDTQRSYDGQVLEKRYFRVFIQSFTHLFQKMLLFEHFDSNKDNHLSSMELIEVEKELVKWNIVYHKSQKISEMSTKSELTLLPFIRCITNVTEDGLSHII